MSTTALSIGFMGLSAVAAVWVSSQPRGCKESALVLTVAMCALPLVSMLASPLLPLFLFHRTLHGAKALFALERVHLIFYCLTAAFLLGVVYHRRSIVSITYAMGLARVTAVGAALQGALLMGVLLQRVIGGHALPEMSVIGSLLRSQVWLWLPLFTLMIIANGFRTLLKRQQFNADLDTTTGNFGSAVWMRPPTFKKRGLYDPRNGFFVGTDQQGRALYLPLVNKLTISPPGGGKTAASSIPALLSHDGPVFVFDIKGELWAVTARYRREQLKRNVIVIDPYRVTQSGDFQKDRPDVLAHHTVNPFDWIPEDKASRDRMINAFAASFVVQEGSFAAHFDENAKILIRGYIDYIMGLPPPERNLATLYRLMTESPEEAEITLAQMSEQEGRAGAAAQQIKRVGEDERGSILSTAYRQLDWLGDSNIQSTLSTSNVDLREFIQGNMDIFVVLPEDQVKEHNRLVRMLLALLMGMLVQANPDELPQKKSLFLLEELAQLGYCPDVEQCIEVLRARGVVVWTVFQTLSQIEQFKKPDLFKGAPLKQIFTNDDTKTMQWVQTLGGKKTVLTKTRSSNSGHSAQKTHAFRGTLSSGEGESIQETAVDLIPLNILREMPNDEQFIFLHGAEPMRCKKVRYFESPVFAGKFDSNPLEENKRNR